MHLAVMRPLTCLHPSGLCRRSLSLACQLHIFKDSYSLSCSLHPLCLFSNSFYRNTLTICQGTPQTVEKYCV